MGCLSDGDPTTRKTKFVSAYLTFGGRESRSLGRLILADKRPTEEIDGLLSGDSPLL